MESQTHHCQTCKRAVILTTKGEIIRSCIDSDNCREPVAGVMTATAYGLARIAQMSPEELHEKGLDK